ncbi:uncharacterized protein LOC134823830 isoform X2 [Bolinopsis microptera]|uniref:uncharacterized protein LOC134823830 isoform X2 n=1 Tax=Bolinopsis microptera TaxID=2820187 RepID=UPI00307923C7
MRFIMNQIINLLFISYFLQRGTEARSAPPPSGLEVQHPIYHSSDESSSPRSRPKSNGRRWRKNKRVREEEDNEIDLAHADFEDSELVSDLNENIIFDKHKDVELIQGDILITRSSHERVKRGAVRPITMLWPNGIIYYKFSLGLGQLKVQLVLSAMQHIMDYTCVKFSERLNETDYLNITSEKGCYSWVGKRGGPQEVSVGSGCVTMGIIAHELSHAIGFYHEQSRPDRDTFVELIKDNIRQTQLENFEKRHETEVDSLNVPYDYGSIMHYGLKDFSENKLPTLKTLQQVPSGVQIGQRVRLSIHDIEQANRLYKCPKKEPSDREVSRSNRKVGVSLGDSLMIVGGNQDTTEPLCLDGMTYKGNFVLVTMCSLSKSSLKWSWTDNYQLRNDGNTLCLSVDQENHMVGGSEDVPMKMTTCDDNDDRQKWICTGGFLKNLALNKCINAGWRQYRRNYMTAVSSCDNSDINQVMSVYGKGKRYEPVCRRWNVGPQLECHQKFPTERTYLGCERDYEAMIGFEKVGKRNNLKAIRSVECCQLTNSTGNVYRTSIRTIYKTGSTECHDGYFVQGLGLARARTGIRLHKMRERSLKALAYLHCMKPSDDISYENCYWDELRAPSNNKGMNVCSRGGFYMTGLYKKGCTRLSCISQIKCCSVNLHTNYT